MTKKIFLFFLLLLFCFQAPFARAHSLWLNIDNNQPKVGQAVQIEIGWGHKFPKDELISEEFMNQVYALNSKGEKISLKKISPSRFEFMPKTPGIYKILANIKPGFLSKTTEGYKLQPKKGLQNVVSCFRFDMRAKAFIFVGDSKKMPDQCIGDPLEITPLKNSKLLKEGDIFPVKVTFDEKALPNVDVRATYAGFSDQPNTYAYSTKTNEEGLARIKILKKGKWVVNVLHEVPYPDPEECDKYRYNYCFTFEVK